MGVSATALKVRLWEIPLGFKNSYAIFLDLGLLLIREHSLRRRSELITSGREHCGTFRDERLHLFGSCAVAHARTVFNFYTVRRGRDKIEVLNPKVQLSCHSPTLFDDHPREIRLMI